VKDISLPPAEVGKGCDGVPCIRVLAEERTDYRLIGAYRQLLASRINDFIFAPL
jgi:hypothetical protein